MFRVINLPTSQKGGWGTKISSTYLTPTQGICPEVHLSPPTPGSSAEAKAFQGKSPSPFYTLSPKVALTLSPL